MELEKYNSAKQIQDNINDLREIVNEIEKNRIAAVKLNNCTEITYLPRGAIKEAIINNCRRIIERLELDFKAL